MITVDKNLGFLKSIFMYTTYAISSQLNGDYTYIYTTMLQGKPHHSTDLWFQKKNFPEISQPTKTRTARRPYCQPHVPYWLILIGHNNIVPLRFFLQTGLNGHHRLLYPVETQNASSSKHDEKKLKKEKRGGEAIWKPDLDMDTWSDAWQTKLFRQKEAVALFQTKYSPITRFVMTPNWSNLS